MSKEKQPEEKSKLGDLLESIAVQDKQITEKLLENEQTRVNNVWELSAKLWEEKTKTDILLFIDTNKSQLMFSASQCEARFTFKLFTGVHYAPYMYSTGLKKWEYNVMNRNFFTPEWEQSMTKICLDKYGLDLKIMCDMKCLFMNCFLSWEFRL